MTKAAIGLSMVFLLMCMPLANNANAADAPAQQVPARDLKTLEIPGKVVAVLWMVRTERCTLQIVYPSGGANCASYGRLSEARFTRPQRAGVAAQGRWIRNTVDRADGTARDSHENIPPLPRMTVLRASSLAAVTSMVWRLAENFSSAASLRTFWRQATTPPCSKSGRDPLAVPISWSVCGTLGLPHLLRSHAFYRHDYPGWPPLRQSNVSHAGGRFCFSGCWVPLTQCTLSAPP